MPRETYDIQELVTQSGVPRRTIYFYVQQGVLPPPEGAGLAAHYTEDHLLRLRLIPILRQQGLRLDEIRGRFTQLNGEEMRALLSAVPPAPAPAARLAAREPFAPQYPAAPAPVGWEQERFTHHNLPAGIVLIAPESLSMLDRQRLNQLLQAARQIFSGGPVIFMEAGQGGDSNDRDRSQTPGAKNAPEEE